MDYTNNKMVLDYIMYVASGDWVRHQTVYQNLKRHFTSKEQFREIMFDLIELGLVEVKHEKVNSNRRTRFYRLTALAFNTQLSFVMNQYEKSQKEESSEEEAFQERLPIELLIPQISPMEIEPEEEVVGDKDGYLYVMYETGQKNVKIGISVNVPQREQQLNSTKMPIKVKLVGKVRSPYYAEAEKILHRLYDKYRIDNSEWFNLDPIETACLMLMTPEHVEELVLRREIPLRSLTELVDGAMETFMNPTSPLVENQSKRRETVIGHLNRVIQDQQEVISKRELEISRLKMGENLANNEMTDRVRIALRSLPEKLDMNRTFAT
jgi:hypothetical protein